jgi:hypothetical protein
MLAQTLVGATLLAVATATENGLIAAGGSLEVYEGDVDCIPEESE